MNATRIIVLGLVLLLPVRVIAEYAVLRNMLIVSTKGRKEREQKSKEEKKLEGF